MNVLEKLEKFYRKFKGEKGSIGKSALNKEIYYFKVQKTLKPIVICQYSIHAREYITTYLALKQIKKFIKDGKIGTVYFIPATNPDGIEICLTKKPLYKANYNGVDLNVNFDAGWGKGKENTFVKGDANFIGDKPFSESESRALANFTIDVNADITISYHAKGEEIYWEFFQTGKELRRDYALAKFIKSCTGYKLKTPKNSFGGYKDWCIEKLHIPAFTIEVGNDRLTHPIKKKHLNKIYKKNKNVINIVTEKYEY